VVEAGSPLAGSGTPKAAAKGPSQSPIREDLRGVVIPSLIMQCSDDVIAPRSVGEYVHEHLAESQLVLMQATGHCPNLSAPEETVSAIRAFLDT